MSTIKIKLVKSPIGKVPKHRKTIKALGLKVKPSYRKK